MKKFRAIWCLTPLLFASTPTVTVACSPIKTIGLFFDHDSATVPADEVLRLSIWMAELRAKYPNHESIDIYGSGEPGERMPSELGLKRAHNVARVLSENLQFDAKKVHLPTSGYVLAPAPDYLKRLAGRDGVRGADLQFLPACPHECPCQSGDPLYDPLRGSEKR